MTRREGALRVHCRRWPAGGVRSRRRQAPKRRLDLGQGCQPGDSVRWPCILFARGRKGEPVMRIVAASAYRNLDPSWQPRAERFADQGSQCLTPGTIGQGFKAKNKLKVAIDL